MSPESSIFDCDSTQKKEINKERKISKFGLFGIGLFGGLAAGIVAITLPFVSPGFRRIVLPYVPATNVQIENVLQALRHKDCGFKKTKRLIDLGSGDGRIVIECAKHGILSHGVELNPWLVLFSKFNAWRENVSHLTSFRRKNLFKVDLSEYDKIVIFGVDSLMPLIEEKIVQDYRGKDHLETSLIVCRFPLPNWEPIETFGYGVDQVWLYDFKNSSLKNSEYSSSSFSKTVEIEEKESRSESSSAV